ncbi:MAG: alpha/beta fold hydrolase [Candidatus Metalachnospira sp.]|nr:alpha/beta fold hydrolase [Candidatus Metalachnospira sp.]
MKKLCSVALAATLVMSCMPLTAFAADISVTAKGAAVEFTDAKPYINSDSRTLVPLRAIAEALDLNVTWDDTAKAATFADKAGTKKTVFTIGENKYTVVSGETSSDVEMDTAAVITDDRTYAPARYLAEAFGYNVSWDGSNSIVSITPSYDIAATEVEIPSARSTKIKATIVMPKVAEGVKVPLVAIAHGHGGNRDENGGLTDIAESLAKAGIATIRMDFPGCGKSEESFQQNTMTNMVSDVYSCIDYAQKNFAIDSTKVGIFGYSMGGRIAAEIAGEGKIDLDGMVLLAPYVDNSSYVKFLGDETTSKEIMATAEKDGHVVYTTKYGQVQELSKAFFNDLTTIDPLAKASSFKGKAMVIYGQDDNTVDPAISQKAAVAFNAKVLDVTGDTHSYSFYSDKPQIRSAIVVNTVNLFLDAFK